MNNKRHLASVPSNEVSYVRFFNLSKKSVSLEWIDFHGHHQIYYSNLKPNEAIDVKTYVGHPFVVYETNYRHQLCFSNNVEKQFMVFFPTSSIMQTRTGSVYVSRRVNIVSPLHKLEELCLCKLHKLIKDEVCVDSLLLPIFLKDQIKLKFYHQKNPDTPIPIK